MTIAAATETLTRDADHRYWIGSTELPGVTAILRGVGLIDYSHVPPDVLERKKALGRAVHEATHYWDEGDLDEATVSKPVRPYLEAWRRFRADAGFCPVSRELQVYARHYDRGYDLSYAGTLDRAGNVGRTPTVVDIKTGTLEPWVALQTAAYAHAVRCCGLGDPARRMAVQLRDDGTYAVTVYDDEGADMRAFLCAVEAHVRLQRLQAWARGQRGRA